MRNKLTITYAILLFFVFIPSIVLAQSGTTTSVTISQAVGSIPINQEYLLEFQRDTFNQIASWNFNFLLIIIGIVTLLTGGLYLFNLKPLKDVIDKSEEKRKEDFNDLSEKLSSNIKISESNSLQRIEELQNAAVESKDKLEEGIEKAKNVMRDIKTKAEEKQKELEIKFENLELDLIFNQYETSNLKKSDIISIINLLDYSEKVAKYKNKHLISIAIPRLNICLSNLIKNNPNGIEIFNKYNYDERVNKVLLEIEKNEDLKKEIDNFETVKKEILSMSKQISETKMKKIK